MEEPQVRRFRRRLAALLVAERGVRLLAVTGFAWGVVVLALRAGLGAPEEWLAGGLAVLLPAALAAAAFQGLVKPDEAVVLICWQGNRSAVIANLLAEQGGYTKVYNVTDGIKQWLKDGHPVVK